MTEFSAFWDGTTVGDAQSYDSDNWASFWAYLFSYKPETEAPIAGYLNEFEVDNPSGQTIRVASGVALVYGRIHINSSSISLAGAIPGAGTTNYYRVVLRCSWASQTIRVDLLGPTVVTYPTLTQTSGTTWEVSLAKVTISDAGVVTITDERDFVTTPLARYIDFRQGGSAVDWSSPGSTNYQSSSTRILAGVKTSAAGVGNGEISVTFPDNGFKHPPIINTQCYKDGTSYTYVCVITEITNSGFSGKVLRGNDTLTNGIDVHWVAYGVPYEAVEINLNVAEITVTPLTISVTIV